MKFDILFPKIHIYKDLLPDHKNLVKNLKESEKDPESSFVFKNWKRWSQFGTYVHQLGYKDENVKNNIDDHTVNFSNLVAMSPREKEENSYAKMVYDAFYKSTSHFLEYYKTSLPEDSTIMGPSFSRYDKNNEEDSELEKSIGLNMARHTDYQPWESEMPGYKFILTCTMYLNDDYEGGEISFKINDEYLDYKPKAGDVLVFPSGHPNFLCENDTYLHGVKKIYKEDRYLIRCFYQIYYPGSKKWHEGKEKYGEELWGKMEEERIKKELDEILKK
jgi:predicted 2-oxoglutarate/Fe(II)-dependent dioxygenase YbiX